MKRAVIVQARMTSTRLPGKILCDVAGRPMLARQLSRLKGMAGGGEIIVATTDLPSDDPVVDLARKEDVGWFRGDEHDVLSRYLGAAREARADLIVRVTADCPLIDPVISDSVIRSLLEHGGADYASNVIKRTYPQGLDTEVFYRDTLERVARMARSLPAREHVTWFIARERADLFVNVSVTDKDDNSDLRWTVDTSDDLAMVRRVYETLGNPIATYPELLAHVRAHPEIANMNQHVLQKHL